ncbi:MAG: helix-turn-helix domain-containing protein [Reichenbachiella sp.]
MVYYNWGEFFEALVKHHKLTKTDIARKLNVDVKSVRRWCQNKNRVHLDNLKDIAELFSWPLFPFLLLENNCPLNIDIETKRHYTQPKEELFTMAFHEDSSLYSKVNTLNTIADIKKIKSYCHSVYATTNPLNQEVIQKAIEYLPGLNLIGYDYWGLYNSHLVVLPLTDKSYLKLKQHDIEEGNLGVADLCDPSKTPDATLYCYSLYSACNYSGSSLINKIVTSFKEMTHNHRIAFYEVTNHGNEIALKFNFDKIIENHKEKYLVNELDAPTLWECNLKHFLNILIELKNV